jgi:hypothetical protein
VKSFLLGYYDFLGDPKVLSPFHTDSKSTELLTQIHETIHKDLTMGSTIGNIASLLALVDQHATSKLPPRVSEGVKMSLSKIVETSLVVQEGLATYLSLAACARDRLEEVARVKESLDGPYKTGVEICEQFLEPLGRQTWDRVRSLALALGYAALSPVCYESVNDLSALTDFIDSLCKDSPDSRFMKLLRALVGTHIKDEFVNDSTDFESVQRRVWTLASEQSIQVFSYKTSLKISELNVTLLRWRTQLKAWGLSILDDVKLNNAEEDEVVMNAPSIQYVLPKLKDYTPSDVSYLYDYTNMDEDAGLGGISYIQRLSNYYIIVNVWMESESRCLVSAYPWPRNLDIQSKEDKLANRRFSFRTTIDELRQVLNTASVLKIDETFVGVPIIWDFIATLSNIRVITLSDTTTRNLIRKIERERNRCSEVRVTVFKMPNQAICLVISNEIDQIYWTSLSTNAVFLYLAETHFSNDSTIRFTRTQQDVAAVKNHFGDKEDLFHGVLITTYRV